MIQLWRRFDVSHNEWKYVFVMFFSHHFDFLELIFVCVFSAKHKRAYIPSFFQTQHAFACLQKTQQTTKHNKHSTTTNIDKELIKLTKKDFFVVSNSLFSSSPAFACTLEKKMHRFPFLRSHFFFSLLSLFAHLITPQHDRILGWNGSCNEWLGRLWLIRRNLRDVAFDVVCCVEKERYEGQIARCWFPFFSTKPNQTNPNQSKPIQTKPNQIKPNQKQIQHKINQSNTKKRFVIRQCDSSNSNTFVCCCLLDWLDYLLRLWVLCIAFRSTSIR